MDNSHYHHWSRSSTYPLIHLSSTYQALIIHLSSTYQAVLSHHDQINKPGGVRSESRRIFPKKISTTFNLIINNICNLDQCWKLINIKLCRVSISERSSDQVSLPQLVDHPTHTITSPWRSVLTAGFEAGEHGRVVSLGRNFSRGFHSALPPLQQPPSQPHPNHQPSSLESFVRPPHPSISATFWIFFSKMPPNAFTKHCLYFAKKHCNALFAKSRIAAYKHHIVPPWMVTGETKQGNFSGSCFGDGGHCSDAGDLGLWSQRQST